MSPRSPRLSTSERRITCTAGSPRHVRQERHLARPLDGDRDLALMPATRSGDPARPDLALLRDVAPELVVVLVVDFLDLLATEEAVLPARLSRRRAASLPAPVVSVSLCHRRFLPF